MSAAVRKRQCKSYAPETGTVPDTYCLVGSGAIDDRMLTVPLVEEWMRSLGMDSAGKLTH